MIKKVLLHIGAHKTGTTTLQHTFAANRALLHKAGLFYPEHNGSVSHHKWSNLLAEHVSDTENFNLLTHRWLNTPTDTLFISAESIYRHIQHQPGYIQKLQNCFAGKSVTPILTLRRQAEYATSLYTEWVMHWQYPNDIYTFIREFYSWFDYEQVTEKISVLGKPVLISYHDIAGPDLCNRFLAKFGYKNALPASSNKLRTSPSPAEVYLKRLFNHSFAQAPQKQTINNVIKNVVHKKFPQLNDLKCNFIWCGTLDSETFEKTFWPSNVRLCEKYGLDHVSFFKSNQKSKTRCSNKTLLKPDTETEKILEQAYLVIVRQSGRAGS